VDSEKNLKREPFGELRWRTHDILPPARDNLTVERLREQIGNKKAATVGRNRPSFELAWLQRVQQMKSPIVLSALHVNDIRLVHLPSECFVEYQLRAQEMQPKHFVVTAAYGDGGPWYIPTREEYPHGGYEVGVAFCDPEVDTILTKGMEAILR
jgi:hypothetical protein